MTIQPIILKRNRRYRFRGGRAMQFIQQTEILRGNAALARMLQRSTKRPLFIIRTHETVYDIHIAWQYEISGVPTSLYLSIKDLPLP